MAIPLAYNVRSVIGRPWSTLATAFGIGMVVAILVLALALATGFQAAIVSTGSPQNVIVLRKGADGKWRYVVDMFSGVAPAPAQKH